jgi:PAS domain S-box-containing protein
MDNDFQELEKKEEELRKIRLAFLNILEDTEEAKFSAVEEKNKTLTIINNFPDGLLVVNEEGEVELISPLVETFFNKKKEEIIGKNIFKISSDKVDLKLLFSILKNKKGIKHVFRQEVQLAKDLFVEVTSSRFEFDKKNGVLVILHNISREKLIERMKTEFVSIAAHQLRTPLSAIKWSLKMILDGDVGKVTEEQKDLLDKTYLSNERMINLINDLLNVTRIEEGRFLYKPELTQIEELIDKVILELEGPINIKKAKVNFKKSLKPLSLTKIDKEKMNLVIHNLLENALKYTISSKSIIDISLEQKKDDIIFKITDNGVGIPKDQQDRIFTKFFRGDNVVKLETEGSGLGLYTTKNIIESHGGKIWFESEENKGTTFYFSIPLKV